VATLRIVRERGNTARLRSFKVLIDRNMAGSIDEGRIEELDVAPGRHVVKLKCDWASSRELEVHLGTDERVELTCRTTASGPWVMFLRPHRYIDVVPSGTTLPAQNALGRELWLRVGTGTGALIALVVILTWAGVSAPITVGAGVATFLLSILVSVPRSRARGR